MYSQSLIVKAISLPESFNAEFLKKFFFEKHENGNNVPLLYFVLYIFYIYTFFCFRVIKITTYRHEQWATQKSYINLAIPIFVRFMNEGMQCTMCLEATVAI